MALLKLSDNRQKIVSHEQALTIWQVLTGEIEPDEQQETFCMQVDQVFFCWREAPDSWIERHCNTVFPVAISAWLCGRDGKPTKPWAQDDWEFAKRWGLWHEGRPSEIVTEYLRTGKINVKPKQQEMLSDAQSTRVSKVKASDDEPVDMLTRH
jgi:hypothetical protein